MQTEPFYDGNPTRCTPTLGPVQNLDTPQIGVTIQPRLAKLGRNSGLREIPLFP
jgi:hypothetical protein